MTAPPLGFLQWIPCRWGLHRRKASRARWRTEFGREYYGAPCSGCGIRLMRTDTGWIVAPKPESGR